MVRTHARRATLWALPLAAMVTGLLVAPGVSGAKGAGKGASSPGRILRATGSATSPVDPWGWPGTTKRGYLPPGEPDVHGGKVKVGLITAGTIHDGNYYQSEVTALDKAAKKFHWTTVVQGSVPSSAQSALSAAQDMCAQGVDLLIIGETQLTGAEPAASSTACKGTPVWLYGSAGTVKQSPYLAISTTTEDPQSYATGVAMGLWLKAHHETKAGFITGPAYTFTKRPAKAYLAGMRSVVKDATLDAVFTGTLTASGPAVTAAQAMLATGIKLIYPYLGSAFFPTAGYITKHGGATLTAGGAWCSHQGIKFAVEQAFDPGYQLAPALTEFAHGKLRVGTVRTFVLGETSVPSVSFCPGSGVGSKGAAALKKVVKKLAIGSINATSLITATPTPS